ncbi:MAG: 2-hydroxyacid dehydrogenase [Chloroflexota bacterium]
MPKVTIFAKLSAGVVEQLCQFAPADFDVEVYPANLSVDDKIERTQDSSFLVLLPAQIEDKVVRAAKELKLIQLVGVGFDKMNLDLCRELGIPIATNGGANAIDVAEHTLAMILAFYRRFRELDANVRNNKWSAIDTGMTTYTIHGKTAGIIGLGQIGRRVAQLLNAFGANVLYYDAFRVPEEQEAALGVTYAPLDDLFRQADIVSLHVPLLPATKGLINADTLALMKPNALVVNTCRGPVIDEAALTAALQAQQIGGAVLDVLEEEPTSPDNPLLTLDNVLLTPHTAGITFDTWQRRGRFIFDNLQRVWAGEEAQAVVNR